MIGSAIRGTLWNVTVTFRDLEAEAKAPADATGPIHRSGQHLIVTAHADGSDVFEVARRHVLKEPRPEHDFCLQQVTRVADVGGTAITSNGARGAG